MFWPLDHGFSLPGRTIYSEQDILGDRLVRRRRQAKPSEHLISEMSSLSLGDIVVHADHGIGRYDGLETLEIGGAPHDCLRLVYAGDDKLFLPVENLDLLSRYGRRNPAPSWTAGQRQLAGTARAGSRTASRRWRTS